MKKIFLLLFVISLSVILFIYKDNIRKSEFFYLKHINISDSKNYNFDLLLKEIIKDGEISLFDIDLEEIEKKLSELSWIKEVQVSKIYPDKLYISLEEHKIKGLVLLDKIYFYNNDYEVFISPNYNKIKKYTIFSGFDTDKYENNFNLFKKNIKNMEDIKKCFKESKLSKITDIDEIHINSLNRYWIILNNKIKILTDYKNSKLNFNRSKKIIDSNKSKENISLIIFDELKEKNKVIVRFKEAENG